MAPLNILGFGARKDALSEAIASANGCVKWATRKKLWQEFRRATIYIPLAPQGAARNGRIVPTELTIDGAPKLIFSLADALGNPLAACFTDEALLKLALPTAEPLASTGEKLIAAAAASNIRGITVNPGGERSASLSIWEQSAMEKKIPDYPTLFEVGAEKLRQGATADAEEVFRRMLALHEQESALEPRLNARVLSALAQCLDNAGQPEEALKLFGRARTIWEKNGGFTSDNALSTLEGLGSVNVKLGRTDQCLENLTLFLDRAATLKDISAARMAKAIATVSQIHKKSGDREAQRTFLEKYADAYRAAHGTTGSDYATILRELADSYIHYQEWEKVEAVSSDLLKLTEGLPASEMGYKMQAVSVAALAKRALDKQDEANKLVRLAADCLEQMPDRDRWAEVIEEVGAHFLFHRRGEDALPFYQRLLEISDLQNKRPESMVNGLRALGICLIITGREDLAREAYNQYQQAAKLLFPANHILVGSLEDDYEELKREALCAPPLMERPPAGENEESIVAARHMRNQIAQRDYAGAAAYCERMMRKNASSPSLLALRGETAMHGGQYDTALSSFRNALELDPKYSHPLRGLGEVYLMLNDPTQAADYFTQYTERRPGDSQGWLGLGKALGQLSRYEQALECYNKALATSNRADTATRVAIFFNCAQTLKQLGHLDDTVRMYNRALALGPDDADTLKAKGAVLMETGDFEGAMECYERLTRVRSNDNSALIALSACQVRTGKAQQALTALDMVLRVDSQNVAAWVGKGEALTALKRYDESTRCFDYALTLAPDDASSVFGKAKNDVLIERYGDSAQAFQKFLKLAAPDDPRRELVDQVLSIISRNTNLEQLAGLMTTFESLHHWVNRANRLFKEGLFDGALQCADNALKADERQIGLWDLKAACLMKLKKWDEALSCYEKLSQLDPFRASIWSSHGECLNNLGRYEEAVASFQRAVSKDTFFAPPWFHQGNALLKLERFEEALAAFDRALSIDPGMLEAHKGKGDAYIRMGQTAEAEKCYQRAMKSDKPDFP